jgi:phage/plasmid-like protein (TIGR03299 family)
MSHELTITNGVAEMAYAGETPWHGLGQTVARGSSIETWAQAAHMEWSIQEAPVQYTAAYRGLKVMPKVLDKKVLFRSDSLAPLGVVGDKFKVVQPNQVLEFFRDLTEKEGFAIETVGTLFGGRRFWALAHIGESCDIVPGDKIGGYLLLCTGADGTLATTAKFTTVRVVCNNTLSMSLDNEAGHQFKTSHRSVFDPTKTKIDMGLAVAQFGQFEANMKRLSDKTVSMARAERLAFDLLKPAGLDITQPAAIETVSNSRAFKSILALFDGAGKGATLAGVAGTAWGFVNAVTEYVDHTARATSTDNRLNAAWFGAGDDLKSKAVNLALTF